MRHRSPIARDPRRRPRRTRSPRARISPTIQRRRPPGGLPRGNPRASRLESAAASPLDAFTGSAAQQIFRRLAATERSYFRALKELGRVQRERKAQEENAGMEPAVASSPAPVVPEEPPIGFVLPIRTHPVPQSVGPAVQPTAARGFPCT